MFKTAFLIGMFMATELTHNSSDYYSQQCKEQPVSANNNVHMPIQRPFKPRNPPNTKNEPYFLTSIEKQISPSSKDITVLETVCVSKYTLFLHKSIKFIEDNYFFDFYSVCNDIFQLDLANNFHNKNICNHEKFKNSFKDYIVKYLDDAESLKRRDSILETVNLSASCYEFVTNFNSRSQLFKLLDRNKLNHYLKPCLDLLDIKYYSEEEKEIYILKIKNLLYSNIFEIFNILFPEIKLVYELITRQKTVSKSNLKKFHLFITYTAFKIKLNEAILREELIMCDICEDKSFTGLKIILSFIYNVRLDFTLMSFNLYFKPGKPNFLVALTYLSFLRLKYPRLLIENDLSEFIILEMHDLENITSFVSKRYYIEYIKIGELYIQLRGFFLRYEPKGNTQDGFHEGLCSKDNAAFNSDFVTSNASRQPNAKSVLELATFRSFSDLKKYFGIIEI